MDPDIEQALDTLRGLRTQLAQWMQSGPYEAVSERIGGVTAEATLATGLTDVEIDHYWLQCTDLAEVASCAVQAVNAAEQACQSRFWENLRDFRIGEFSPAEFADPARMHKLLQDPTAFFQSFTTGTEEEARGRRNG